MNWDLYAWAPNTAFANQTIANAKARHNAASPGGILDGFRWSRAPSGDCKELRFNASRSTKNGTLRLNIGPRDIIALDIVDDSFHHTNVFRGVVIQCPQPNDPNKGEYVIVGLRKLIERALTVDRALDIRQDVAAYINDVGVNQMPAAINYTQPADTGFELSYFDAPYIKLSQAFDLLAQSVPGCEWGVNAEGAFFFGPPSGSLTLTTSEAHVRYLPIDAEDVISAVTILALNGQPNIELRDDTYGVKTGTNLDRVDRQSGPIAHTYESAQHDTYEASAASLTPDPRASLKADLAHGGYSTSGSAMNNLANAFDGNAGTYAEWSGAGTIASVFFGASDVTDRIPTPVGWRIKYHASAGISIRLAASRLRDFSTSREEISLDLPNNDGIVDTLIILPPDNRLRPTNFDDNNRLEFSNLAAGNIARVYEFQPLYLDTGYLDRVAASLIRLPASEPTQVTLYRYEAPVPTVAITGTQGNPDGDAKEWRYELSTEGLKTIIDLGVRDEGEDARVIRLNAQGISDQSQDTLRVWSG